jgi:hypothetical protein
MFPGISAGFADLRRVEATRRALSGPVVRRPVAAAIASGLFYQSLSRLRSRATAWPCSWQIRDSETSITAAISLKFISCS